MEKLKRFIITGVVISLFAWSLPGCGGGGGGGSTGTPPGDGDGAVSLSGVAATGAPLAAMTVTLRDKNGVIRTIVAGADGKFTFDLAGTAAPYLLKVPAGSRTLYSVATAAGTANIHPFTDLIIRNWYIVKGGDVDTDFSASGALAHQPSADEIATVEAVVRNVLKAWLAQEGIDATNFNLITSSFDADSAGFDKILDNTDVSIDATGQVTVETTDPLTGIGGTAISTNIADLTAADTDAPTAADGLTALAGGADKAVLLWNASTDNVGIAGYNVYRNGTNVGASPYPVFQDTGLAGSTQYCYQVEAFDGAGNLSAKSGEACATTLAAADTSAPAAPSGLTATAASSSRISLTWTASTDGVLGYQVFRGGPRIGATAQTSFVETGLSENVEYCYTVKAFDAAGNVSAASSQACATTAAAAAPAMTIWKSSMPGTVLGNESGEGQTTYFTAVITQTGASVAGTLSFRDSLGRSGSVQLTGSISGSAITTSGPDFDPACAGRTITETGTIGTSVMSLTVTAPAAGTCNAMTGGDTLTFKAVTPQTALASGTFTFLASSGTLTINTTSSSFPANNGPQVGAPEAITGVTINATTMLWANDKDNMTWTRASGAADDITGGIWTMTNSEGDVYQLECKSDGAFKLVGSIVSGNRGNARVHTQNWGANGGYFARPMYDDPEKTAFSVSVSGPGIVSSLTLTYDQSNGAWQSWALPDSPVSLGTTRPALPLTYTFTITDASGKRSEIARANCIMDVFPTGLSVTQNPGETPTAFNWIQVPYSNISYHVEVHNQTQSGSIWSTQDLSLTDASTVAYTGPVLDPGNYGYFVSANSWGGEFECQAFSQGSFTVGP
jgi:chitodextrinase